MNNAGIDGHTTYGHLVLLRSFVVHLRPKVAIFLIGANDVGLEAPNTFDDGIVLSQTGVRRAVNSLARYSETVSLGLNLARAAVARNRGLGHSELDVRRATHLVLDPEAMNRTEAEYEKYLPGFAERLRQIGALTRANGIEPVFVTQPALFGDVVDPATAVNLAEVQVNGRGNGHLEWRLLERVNDTDATRCERERHSPDRSGRRAPEGFHLLLRLSPLHERGFDAGWTDRRVASDPAFAPEARQRLVPHVTLIEMRSSDGEGETLIADNRKAFFDYHVLDTFEAGIALLGTEVKGIREGKANLRDSYARVESRARSGSTTCTSTPTAIAATPITIPKRRRKLLLHRAEIRKLIGKTVEKGLTLVPTRMYFKNGARQSGAGAGQGQAGARQARDDPAARDRSRDAGDGQRAAAVSDPIWFNRPAVTGRELDYMRQALDSGAISGDGPFTRRCHALLEQITGAPKALLTTSCTHALEMAALLLDIQPGDEVICPAFTFVSTVNAFVLRGARPVFVDIRPDTLNLDETRARRRRSRRAPRRSSSCTTPASRCEMDAIIAIAAPHGIAVVEDNAHGLFGRYKGRPLGSLGASGDAQLSRDEERHLRRRRRAPHQRRALRRAAPRSCARRAPTAAGSSAARSISYTWVDVGSSYLPSDLLAAYLLAQLEARDGDPAAAARDLAHATRRRSRPGPRHGVRLPIVPDRLRAPGAPVLPAAAVARGAHAR